MLGDEFPKDLLNEEEFNHALELAKDNSINAKKYILETRHDLYPKAVSIYFDMYLRPIIEGIQIEL